MMAGTVRECGGQAARQDIEPGDAEVPDTYAAPPSQVQRGHARPLGKLHREDGATLHTLEPSRHTYLDAGPLVAAVEARGGPTALVPRHSDRRSGESQPDWTHAAYHKAKRRGVLTVFAADRLAVKLLRLHPCEVWGEGWWEA